MARSSFYAVTFTDASGVSQVGRIFASIKNARKSAADVAKFGTNVRIMKGGPGGIEVKYLNQTGPEMGHGGKEKEMRVDTAKELQDALDAIDYNGTLNRDLPDTIQANPPERGGRRDGSGRHKLSADEPTVPVTIRLTESQRAAFRALGSGKWLREKIDEAQRLAQG